MLKLELASAIREADWLAELEVPAADSSWRADDMASSTDGTQHMAWEAQLSLITHIRAKKGAPTPVDRRKTGSKHHLICDGRGTPLKVMTTAANVNDVTQTLALVDGIPPVAGRPADDRRPCSATKATTPTPTATNSVADESCPSSPARDHPTS
ncbi:transposase [Streptomyces sp. 130]|uniref:transposase n=1 Tax=Streptomyces sp. 130 TaxID=2591006 RepID=UPI00163D463F|nr:transposase [Streptomyces sp. 130]